MKYIPNQSPAERFKGHRYEVVDGLSHSPHRVVDRRLGSIVGNYRSLAEANERASSLDGACAPERRAPIRHRAQAALAYVVLFSVFAGSILRRLMP